MTTLRESIPLDPKKIAKKTISSGVTGVVFFIVVLIFILGPIGVSLAKKSGILSPFLLFIIFTVIILVFGLIIAYIYQSAYFRMYFYDEKDGFLVIKKGVIIPKEVTLPFEKLNDVYVDQDILDRMFGLYDVHFSTATAQSGMQAHIDGLNKENADKLKFLILKLIKKSVKK